MKRSEWTRQAVCIITAAILLTVCALFAGILFDPWLTLVVYAILTLAIELCVVIGYEHTHALHANSMRDIIRNMGCGISPDAIPEDALRQATILLREHEAARERQDRDARNRLISKFINDNSHTAAIHGTRERVFSLQRDLLKMEYPGFILVNISIQEFLSSMERSQSSTFCIDDYQRISYQVTETFERHMSQRFVGYCTDVHQNFVCLINLSGYTTEEITSCRKEILAQIIELVRAAQQELETRWDIYSFCSIPSPITSIEKIHKSLELSFSLEFYARLVEWKDSMIIYDELPAPDARIDDERSRLRKKYFSEIIARNFSKAEETFALMISPQYLTHPENALNYRRDILVWLGTTFDLLEFAVAGNTELSGYMDAISDSDSIDEIITQVHNIFGMFPRTSEELPAGDSSSKIDQICQFINENYTDPDLSLTSICEVFHLNTSYLSHLFKQATGQSILQYIHLRRLADVKRLLAESDMNLTDISQQTGYPSGWTMSRAFKRYEGISPKEYRQQLRPGFRE